MHILWTPEQALGLAPDRYSLKMGRTFAQPDRWSNLGYNQQAAWGEFPVSGKPPFRTTLNLAELRFDCTCFNRKFPCTHSLSLLLLLIEQPEIFTPSPPPDWVTAWLKNLSPPAPAHHSDRPAAADRQRQANLMAGLQELDLWLRDLLRSGFAAAQEKPKSYWIQMADRLVDMQAGNLAGEIRQIPTLLDSHSDWPEHLLKKLGRLHLLIQGFARLDRLPEPMQADLRAAVGWLPRPTETPTGRPQHDHWHVLARRTEQEGKQRLQRTWLWGNQHNQPALIIDLAYGRQPLDTSLVVGTVIEAELHFHAGTVPLQAHLTTRHRLTQAQDFIAGTASIKAALDRYTTALTTNPWSAYFPLALTAVTPLHLDQAWFIRDQAGYALPLPPKFEYGWHLLALSQGHPLSLFGEWDGRHFQPLTVWQHGRLLELHLLGGVT